MSVTFSPYRKVSGVGCQGRTDFDKRSRLGNKSLISKNIATANVCPDTRNLTPETMILEQSTGKRLHSIDIIGKTFAPWIAGGGYGFEAFPANRIG